MEKHFTIPQKDIICEYFKEMVTYLEKNINSCTYLCCAQLNPTSFVIDEEMENIIESYLHTHVPSEEQYTEIFEHSTFIYLKDKLNEYSPYNEIESSWWIYTPDNTSEPFKFQLSPSTNEQKIKYLKILIKELEDELKKGY